MRGIDEVHHLAFVNGTATFYSAPDLVLDVGSRASSMSSTPAAITAWTSGARLELGGLSIAAARADRRDRAAGGSRSAQPRLSYGAGKIISEMMVITTDASTSNER